MVSFDIILVENAVDAIIAAQQGIFDFVIDDGECENCGMVIGPIADEFFPCAIVSDNEDVRWPICIDCAFPLVYPRQWMIGLGLDEF